MRGSRSDARRRRHRRVRKTVRGGGDRPRLAVFRSNRHIYAQVVDDDLGDTIAAASSQEKELRGRRLNVETAEEVGRLVAARAKEAGVRTVVFDRGGYAFHGRVSALAHGAREEGLAF